MLRPLRAEDYDALYSVAADPLIWEQHPVKNRHEAEVFAQFFREALVSGGTLIAVDAGTSRVIGSSRFHGYDASRDEVEIGWTFLTRSHWGGVYNGEMKRLMLRHAFRFVSRVIFLVGPENVRSQRAVERSAPFAWDPGATLAGERAICTRSPRHASCRQLLPLGRRLTCRWSRRAARIRRDDSNGVSAVRGSVAGR